LVFGGPNRRGQRGAAAVEMAILLPVLVMLVFGIIELGRGYQVKIQLTGAVREGARARALGASTADTQQAVIDATAGLSPALAAGDVNAGSACPTSGAGDATVTATYNLPYSIPLVISGTYNFTLTGVMRCGL
jgi:Flp pilus assembly protein TadG